MVKKGERIYLKESSGLVRGVAKARKVVYRKINGPEDLRMIRQKYNQRIMGKEIFWESSNRARYCTLIFLEGVRALAEPFRISKKDMRGWVVLDGMQGFDFPAEKR